MIFFIIFEIYIPYHPICVSDKGNSYNFELEKFHNNKLLVANHFRYFELAP